MAEEKLGHLTKLPIEAISEEVLAEPKVKCPSSEALSVLKDLTEINFVGKIKDVGKGAKKRLEKGLPQEYLYVFKYPCKLKRRDADYSGITNDNVLIYIKINDRKIPYKKVFIISFHKNRIKVD